MNLTKNIANRLFQKQSAIVFLLFLSGCFEKTADDFVGAAKKDISNNNRGAAVIQLKNALQKNSSLAEARFLLGRLLLESGDVEGAIIELEKARELGFEEDKLVPVFAQTLLAQGKANKLVADFGGTTLQASDSISELQAALANAYGELGKLDQSKERVDAAIKADPKNTQAQIIRARLIASTDGVDAGLRAVDSLVNAEPTIASAWQLKGDLLVLKGGNVDAAVEAYRRAIVLDKSNISAHSSIIGLLIAKQDFAAAKNQLNDLRKVNPKHPRTLFYTALVALETNDFKLAQESVQVLIKMMPDDARVLHLAGAINFRIGSLVQAESFLVKSLKNSSDESGKATKLLAQTYLRMGESTKAITTLQSLIQPQSKDGSALGLAAQAYLQSGDSKRAEELLYRAAALNPRDMSSRTALALVKVARGQGDVGLAELRNISTDDSGTVADLALVNALVQRRDFDQALVAIAALEAKTPKLPTASYMRGNLELVRGNKEKARQAFDEALKIDPVFFPAANSLGVLDVESKQFDSALARLRGVVDIEPKNVRAHMAMIAVKQKAGASNDELAAALLKLVTLAPSDPAPRLALIAMQIERKEQKLALTAALDAVSVLPDSPELWSALGMAQAITGDTNQALSSLNKSLSLRPSYIQALMQLAELHAKTNNSVAAAQSLRRVIAINPNYLPAQTSLISLELAGGRISEARAIARNIQSQHEADGIGQAILGDIEANTKNWNEAANFYRAALKKKASPEVAMKLHRVLLESGKAVEQAQFEDEWMKQNKNDVAFLYHMGDIAMAKGAYSLAERRFIEVLKVQPNNFLAANNLAWLLLRSKKTGALEYAEKANQWAPNQPIVLDTLAEIHAAAGRLEKAIEFQKRAVDLAPNGGGYRVGLARYYISAGQKSAAREELDRLAKLGPKFPQQGEVQELLSALK
ncbi:XrtA/PEP-CTERM system TPR-repeat protein PrsT [Paucibacter sp. AS339]|uniref:XrtA/PEP-CTERM system TPR-repeat protein PrsT n=1 Tax=Paucibacter hankyongi TaxID=3133434 RepID=UPI0030B6062D